MTFTIGTYANLVSAASPVQERVTPSYAGAATAFDVIVVGSGMGGGLLADALAEQPGRPGRVLVLEAGSYLYPTHVYNCSRLANTSVAQHFGCETFYQNGGQARENYIHEWPQLNFGGRSIFWSGLIPTAQPWELDFFPPRVRDALTGDRLDEAGRVMNQSVSLGRMAKTIVEHLGAGPLSKDFIIAQTPRALHQPYLRPDGTPAEEFLIEPTGVFNTAELLIDQLMPPLDGRNSGSAGGLDLLLNHFVEDVRALADGRLELVVRDTLGGTARFFQARRVVLAGGSIESPKLLARSTLGRGLPQPVRDLIGRGLTDHPTTHGTYTKATHLGPHALSPNALAKIILYTRGTRDAADRIRYPFNVEMNVNHEYWHLRENDPSNPAVRIRQEGESIVDIKFSFGNCLDPANAIQPAPPFGYVPEIVFRNQNWTDHLVKSRLPALAGWDTDAEGVFRVLNEITEQIFAQFRHGDAACKPQDGVYGRDGKGFGWGTVHHAAGSLRMPARARYDGDFAPGSVVDEDLRVVGTDNLYVCDMSVMPFASAANPVRTLAALALRLSRHLGETAVA